MIVQGLIICLDRLNKFSLVLRHLVTEMFVKVRKICPVTKTTRVKYFLTGNNSVRSGFLVLS